MLGIDPKAARVAWTVFLLALLLATAYAVRETLAVFAIALLFAYLLIPLVGFVGRITPRRMPPRVALAIVYLALVGAIVALALTLGSRLADEANSLATQLPALLKNPTWMQNFPLPAWLEPARANLIQKVQGELSMSGQEILPYVKGLGGQLVSGAKYALYFVLIPILAFFFLKDGATIRDEFVAALVEERRKPIVDDILEDINLLLGEYIRALVLLSAASFAANSLFLAFTGAPYAVLLAGVAALGEFVPVVGPAAGGLVIVLVTGLSGYSHVLLYLLFWILWRMVQDYAISPYLMSRGVQLNPMLVLFGVLAGDQIAGVLGMFLSVPLLAILRVVFVRLRRGRALEVVTPRSAL
ncbi:MAG TPA: AI-2E family transporter [Bryobacteraceae bacterium]|nr:AI-2E family transporter [Bryobacteraceae bacterium]